MEDKKKQEKEQEIVIIFPTADKNPIPSGILGC